MIKKFRQDDTAIFNKLKENITYQTLFIDMKGNGIFSYSLKEFTVLIGTIIIPIIFLIATGNKGMASVLPENRWKAILGTILFWGVLLLSFVLYFVLKHIYQSRFLSRFRSRLVIIGLLEVSLITYGSLVLFNIFPHSNVVSMLMMLICYFGLSVWLIKLILDVKIKETLNKRYGQNFKISKMSRYLSSYPAVVLSIVVFAAYFYRTTKSAFILTHNDRPVSFLYNLVGGVGFLLIGLSISLLPTLLFDGELFVRGKLLQKHSEHFRK